MTPLLMITTLWATVALLVFPLQRNMSVMKKFCIEAQSPVRNQFVIPRAHCSNRPADLWTTAQRFHKAPNLMVHSNALMEDTTRVDPNNCTIHVMCLSNLLFVMMPFQIRRVALGWEDLMLDGMMLTIAAMSAMTPT